jgi:hypothetical protein
VNCLLTMMTAIICRGSLLFEGRAQLDTTKVRLSGGVARLNKCVHTAAAASA